MLTRRIFLASSIGAVALSTSVPELLAAKGAKHTLVAKRGKASLLEDANTETDVWAYDGLIPGPTIRVRQGEEISIEVLNQLDQPTTIHWHGIRIDNAMDGVAGLTQSPIMPGESFTYRFTPPDAGTYWYHPHNRTWEQLARGLYGTLIVEGDSAPDDFDRDYPIVADDWRLAQNGLIDEDSLGSMRDWSHAGRLGNVLTLNGKPFERLDVVNGERIRFRFINTANARVMRFAIDGHNPLLVGLDGQAIPPVEVGKNGVTIAPAQRADLLVDINGSPGDEIAIVETSGEEGLVAGYLVCGEGEATRSNRDPHPTLRANSVPKPNLLDAAELELVMTGGAMRFLSKGVHKGQEMDGRELAQLHQQLWAFNGIAGMAEEPFFSARKGETVKINLVNETGWPHAIHLHGHHFSVLSRTKLRADTGARMYQHEQHALRDTVLVERDEAVEIALLADNPGKWMLHCHMLEHQASGMATWFEVR